MDTTIALLRRLPINLAPSMATLVDVLYLRCYRRNSPRECIWNILIVNIGMIFLNSINQTLIYELKKKGKSH